LCREHRAAEPRRFEGRGLVAGRAEGPLIQADVGLSFWGGIHPETGVVIDQAHPLAGRRVAGAVLAVPSGRGSCTGSAVLLELIMAGVAPAALVFREEESILPLGALVAGALFGRTLPIVRLSREDFAALAAAERVAVVDGQVLCDGAAEAPAQAPATAEIALSADDRALLDGARGEAAALAMRIVVEMARLQGVSELVSVERAHLDCCIHTGPVSVAIAERFRDLGARVAVPTTLNAISIDRNAWRAMGVPERRAAEVTRQTDAYLAMGARPSFTCAPYLLDGAPAAGEQIAWGESNAVAFANSVLGACTEKYPDYLDLCVALTGRAPRSGCHAPENRKARVGIAVAPPDGADDAFWPMLGYLAGEAAPNAVPFLTGLETSAPSRDDLKAFSAAFATTSAAPMFHIAGVTPEAISGAAMLAPDADPVPVRIGVAEFSALWTKLNGSRPEAISCVAIGNPHASLEELERLAVLCAGRRAAPAVSAVVTLGRDIHARAAAAGVAQALESFGFRLVRDTCWCMIEEPELLAASGAILTNSGKYVHYGPGLTGRTVRLAGLAACVEAAASGMFDPATPGWLRDDGGASASVAR
jgi:hypothetical protein